MKKIFTLIFSISIKLTFAQATADFENLALPIDTFWNGSNSSLTGFESGYLSFNTVYNPAFGGYWESGFAYSSMRDSVNGGYLNLYNSRPGGGFNSNTYVVGQQNSVIKSNGQPIDFNQMYLTNSTYAANSMRDGDAIGKKFGGVSGNDPDYFKLTFKGYRDGVLSNDSDEFYLADFRFADNSQDYIVNNWRVFNPSTLNYVDSIKITMSSSDVGQFGINTPLFFCMDNITSAYSLKTKEDNNSMVEVFPNPANNFISINYKTPISESISIFNSIGELIMFANTSQLVNKFDVSTLAPGLYFVKLQSQNQSLKFLKE